MEKQRDFSLLLKPYWMAKDIAAFLGCSLNHANEIKSMTEKDYGSIALDADKKERSVAADDVLKIIGGKDRVTESMIYKNLRSDENV